MRYTANTPWTLWARDTFDRESPATAEHRGTDPREAFYLLWSHALREGITEDGQGSFTAFSLRWEDPDLGDVSLPVSTWSKNPQLLSLRQQAGLEGSHVQGNPVVQDLADRHREFWETKKSWSQSYEAAEELLKDLGR